MDSQDATKAERVAEFFQRLGAAPLASNFDEAYRQVCDILNGVENEMTSIPFDPRELDERWAALSAADGQSLFRGRSSWNRSVPQSPPQYIHRE